MNVIEFLKDFYKNYKGEKGFIGCSERQGKIPYFKVGNGSIKIIVVGAIHAREYITTYLILKLIKDGLSVGDGSVYFVPMLNIDGVKICLDKDKMYKANANGVDLNVNFDARFGSGKHNVFYPNSENYVGAFPFSEKETKALRDFTLKIKPDMTISYHSKGEEIYYNFFQDDFRKVRDEKLASVVQQKTGYTVKTIFDSAGGYKDWCIEKLLIPALTIEVGSDKLSHPIEKEHLQKIYLQNKGIPSLLIQKIKELKDKNEY